MVIRAKINHTILSWARKTAGLDIDLAAKKIGTSSNRLKEWEKGKSFPTVRQVRLMGRVYRRPSAFFYLSKPPQEPPELADFRKIPDSLSTKSPQLRYEIRLSRFRRQTALDLFTQLGEVPPTFDIKATVNEGTEAIANRIRQGLKADLSTQMSWKDPYEALRSWIIAAENSGVLVCQFSGVEIKEARGFSISDQPLPVLSINTQDSPRGRIFTLLHEVAHLSLNLGGLCDLHEEKDTEDELEPFFNQVAGETLVPSSAILSQDLVYLNDSPEWSDGSLQTLANRFMVSREVILRRLLTLGRTTRGFYDMKRRQFLEEYTAYARTGFVEYHRKVLRNNGIAFTSLLLNAYYSEVISARDLSRYLGNVKLKHVHSIEHDLGLSQ
jgi:Zn-dependent peptidase ImmA (M78 family)/transcriptional regulator with XRE-family HTH domain